VQINKKKSKKKSKEKDLKAHPEAIVEQVAVAEQDQNGKAKKAKKKRKSAVKEQVQQEILSGKAAEQLKKKKKGKRKDRQIDSERLNKDSAEDLAQNSVVSTDAIQRAGIVAYRGNGEASTLDSPVVHSGKGDEEDASKDTSQSDHGSEPKQKKKKKKKKKHESKKVKDGTESIEMNQEILEDATLQGGRGKVAMDGSHTKAENGTIAFDSVVSDNAAEKAQEPAEQSNKTSKAAQNGTHTGLYCFHCHQMDSCRFACLEFVTCTLVTMVPLRCSSNLCLISFKAALANEHVLLWLVIVVVRKQALLLYIFQYSFNAEKTSVHWES
jgi:hypothetical protein